ncbi:transporter [Coraliomargarita sp. SDUM461003]|uniref:Transporter n=1 Tax=Thalassobacterium maritimum TaxID=3041265 RepID=A0ABU1AWL9_9BACT|nr:transporter [Coraliomargarita sp. SDUM461003]MDQ8208488.1 transporter [Coraliomargarita sp. SDUM461003]
MKTSTQFITLALTLTAATTAHAAPAAPVFSCCSTEEHQHIARPDDHAPISVMGDHTHSKDSWMLSYRYMNMQMDGMRSGTDRVTSGEVFAADGGYTVTPEWMTMDMHMLGAMYAPTEKLTLMLMANYIETEMEHSIVSQMAANMINGGETEFTTQSSGLGDLKLSALYRFYLQDNQKAHFGLGLSLPTGSIDEKDTLPAMGGAVSQQMPASMQLGSGTFDLLPSLTYVQQFTNWSWGAQANGTIRLQDENSNDYRLGHKFELLSWAGYNLTDWLGLNGGLSYGYTGKLKGDQKDVNLMGPNGRSVPTAFNENSGGERIDVLLGINLLKPSGRFAGHRLSLDLRLPLWQDLNGYQLETDSTLTLGWSKAF